MTNLIDFFTQFLGSYTVQTFDVTTKIMEYNPSTSSMAIESVTNTYIPNGVGAWDIEYLCRFILLMLVLRILYNIPRWSLQIFNNTSKRVKRFK